MPFENVNKMKHNLIQLGQKMKSYCKWISIYKMRRVIKDKIDFYVNKLYRLKNKGEKAEGKYNKDYFTKQFSQFLRANLKCEKKLLLGKNNNIVSLKNKLSILKKFNVYKN